jgi:hypothetical protein
VSDLRWIVAIIGAETGLCFIGLAERSISILVIAPNFFTAGFTGVAAWFPYVAFRAAISGRTDEDSVLEALRAGIVGAFVGLLIFMASFAMFGQTIRTYFAHPLGLHTSQLSMFHLLEAFVWLGFGAGFVLRMQTLRAK